MQQKFAHEELISQIKKRMHEQGVTYFSLGQALGVSRNTVNKMMLSKTMTISRLQEISVILNYNFFQVIANRLALESPPSAEQEKIKQLETEKQVLIQALRQPSS